MSEDNNDFAKSLQEEFNLNRFDTDRDGEKTFTFRQEDFDQGCIANQELVGKKYTMCNQFPLALRLAKFVPYPDHFIYQVRKCSVFPSSVED